MDCAVVTFQAHLSLTHTFFPPSENRKLNVNHTSTNTQAYFSPLLCFSASRAVVICQAYLPRTLFAFPLKIVPFSVSLCQAYLRRAFPPPLPLNCSFRDTHQP